MKVTQCCCGCSLKLGSMIIGILCFLGSTCGLFLAYLDNPSVILADCDDKCTGTVLWYINNYSVINLIEGIFGCIYSAGLVFGIENKQTGLLEFFIFGTIIDTISSFVFSMVMSKVHPTYFIGWPISAALAYYFCVVVYSLKCEFEDETTRLPPYNDQGYVHNFPLYPEIPQVVTVNPLPLKSDSQFLSSM